MKRCPECRRDYYDETLLYCLEDGTALVQGPVPQLTDEPQTAILQNASASEAATRAQIHTTDKTAVIPSEVLSDSNRMSFDKRYVLIPIALAVIVFGGFLGYRYVIHARQIESIAVMPFVNESGNAEIDYLSDGMTETLISSLSQLPNLNIKPRSIVFRYKGKDVDPQTVGKELGVEAMLNGRVVSRGGDLSLFIELIDVASTKVIWSKQYNRKQSDLVALQGEIARDVSGKVNAGLSESDEKKVSKSSTDNPEAYRLYLLANSLAARRKVKDLRTALDYYEQAIALDPNYALAYVGVASSHVYMAIYCGEPGATELPKARTAALRAMELDPALPDAHNIMGGIELYLNRDFAANERENNLAIELNPNFGNAYRHTGIRLAWLGRFDEALAAFHRAYELDPMSMAVNANIAWCLSFAGRLDESEVQLRKAMEIDSSFWFLELAYFINARAKHDYESAAEHLARMQELRDEPEAAKFIRESFRGGGWTGLLRSSVDKPEQSKLPEYYLATFAVELGDKERAFELLNKSNEKYDQFIFFLKIDPTMVPLRGDQRYTELLKKLGFPDV